MSRFLRVQCDCGQEATVFGDAKTEVACKKCGKKIVEPSGGRAQINCRIIEVLS